MKCLLVILMVAATAATMNAQHHMVHGSGGGINAGVTTIIHGTFGQPVAGALYQFETTSQNAGFWIVRDTVSAPPSDTIGSVVIVVDTATPAIGDIVALPIRLIDAKGLDALGADTVEITLRFEGTCLEVRGNGQPIYEGDTAQAVIIASRSQLVGDVLTTLDLRARLGSVTGTVIRISRVTWRGAPSVITTTHDGSIQIEGVCMAGGRARLIRDAQASFIRRVAPNPARSSVIVAIHGRSDERQHVRLVDMVGRVIVSEDVVLRADGLAEVVLDCHSVAAGLYAVQLVSGASFTSTPVMVQR